MHSKKALFLVVLSLAVASCSSGEKAANQSSAEGRVLGVQVDDVNRRFLSRDPSMSKFFDGAHGYALFPSVGKGGIGIGGAHGEGQVFEQRKLTGVATLSQVTVGLQLGGQEYSEVIFFKDKEAYDNFVGGNFELSAQASAVAAKAGAATTADYENGVAIFTMTTAGLMFEATVGGQKFEYIPIRND